MSDPQRALELLVNPSAGGGRAGRLLGAMTRELERAGFTVNVHRLGGRSQVAPLVRSLVEARAPVIASMGGDGTFHDVLNGLRNEDGSLLPSDGTAFALIPAGTGGDLAARTLRMPSDPAAVGRYLSRASPRPFDLGKLQFTGNDDAPAVRFFVNIASFGISGRVDRLVAEGPTWLGGKAAYFVASLRATLGWRHQPVKVLVDGETLYEGPILTVAVCNGRSFGGGMLIAPDAAPDDGMFDVVVLGDLTFGQQTLLSGKLYQGRHLGERGVTHGRGRVVEVHTRHPSVLLDVDGETPGRVPGTFTLLPGAVKLLGAA
ncbi:MAG: diacylglycerol kinase family lipid kinase [Deltaproteobacteria bacterium]|nr:diacylglycerol kinase family lipid kinase [Deltaproteobacteria bacterium]